MAPPSVGPGRRSFRFRQRIGQGAFGEVYLAELVTGRGFSKLVAVKLLKPEFSEEQDIVGRMRDEARLLGHLQHPAIIQADDLVLLGGRIAIVMEYVPGANLLSLIKTRINPDPVPPAALAAVIGRVAEALEAAWSRPSTLTGQPLRVLHRDIKPSNIRITPDGEVKVLDFGVARADAMEREATTHNQLVGSLTFLAPEVFLGQPLLPATDIYALGVTFFESLARNRFGRCGLTPEKQADHLARRLPELALAAWGPCADPIRDLITDMLAFEPERRPTAAHVASTCLQVCRQAPGPELKYWAREHVERVAAAEEIDPHGELAGSTLEEDSAPPGEVEAWDSETEEVTKQHDTPPPRRRHLQALLLLLGIPALAAGVAGVVWWMGRGQGADTPASTPAPSPVAAPPAPAQVAVEPPVPVEPEPVVEHSAPPAPAVLPSAPPGAEAPPATAHSAPVVAEEPPATAPSAPVVAEEPPAAAPADEPGSAEPAALQVHGPRRSLRNSPLAISVRLDAPDCHPAVHWQVEGQSAWQAQPLQGEGPLYTWTLDVTGEHRPALLYYVTADPCGAQQGSATAPMRVVVI